MKVSPQWLPAGLILVAAVIFYVRDALTVRQLEADWSAGAVGVRYQNTSAKQNIPAVAGSWSVEDGEKFLAELSDRVAKEQAGLLKTGAGPDTEISFYKSEIENLNSEELTILCGLPVQLEEFFSCRVISVQCSIQEIRDRLISAAAIKLLERDPFSAINLPAFKWLSTQPPKEALHAHSWLIGSCARHDPEATRELLEKRYEGRNMDLQLLRIVMGQMPMAGIPEKIALAKKWGVLDRLVEFWPAEASQTPAGQEAWLEAVREASPPDKDAQLAKFAKEVETSHGFEGVQRLIGQIAEPGSALYHALLREAAGRDLEEAAGPKADWIMAQVSPAAAVGTAETLMKQWTETDPLAASEWLDAVPRAALWRRAAILAFVSGIEPHDPEAAAQWRLAAGPE